MFDFDLNDAALAGRAHLDDLADATLALSRLYEDLAGAEALGRAQFAERRGDTNRARFWCAVYARLTRPPGLKHGNVEGLVL